MGIDNVFVSTLDQARSIAAFASFVGRETAEPLSRLLLFFSRSFRFFPRISPPSIPRNRPSAIFLLFVLPREYKALPLE